MITRLGTIQILNLQEILAAIASELSSLANNVDSKNKVVALTGGSTPKAFYKYIAKLEDCPTNWENLTWTTSDERHVPIQDEESNFGNAERGMLDAIGVADHKKLPWDTELNVEDSASKFNDQWKKLYGDSQCFDLCFLGMGDDCHTASLFPGSPLIESGIKENFASVEVPGKGMRLTITEAGFEKCSKIVITVTGKGKINALRQVFQEEINFKSKPVQLLKKYSDKVVWLIDNEAASDLFVSNNSFSI